MNYPIGPIVFEGRDVFDLCVVLGLAARSTGMQGHGHPHWNPNPDESYHRSVNAVLDVMQRVGVLATIPQSSHLPDINIVTL